MHTSLCFDLWTPQVPLCAPTVTGPEVKTEKRCRHLAAITHTSTYTSPLTYTTIIKCQKPLENLSVPIYKRYSKNYKMNRSYT